MKRWHIIDDNDCSYHELPISTVDELIWYATKHHGEIHTMNLLWFGYVEVTHTSGLVMRYMR